MSVDLVTGGAGFIGSHLVRRLLAERRNVRVIDDLSTGDPARLADLPGPIDLVQIDLATADLAPHLTDVSRVFHLAAVPSVPRSVNDPLRTHQAVATATLRLLIASRDGRVERFVFSSSSSVYGDTETSPKHEGLPLRPLSPYAVAKAAAESYVRVFADLYGLSTVALRYFNVFGPAQDPLSQYAAVIPLFITRALAGRPLPIDGDGTQTRDFTYVDNVVDANVKAADADAPGGGVYNIAAGDPHSLLDLVTQLERLVGHPLERVQRPRRAGDIKHSHADVSAAKRDLRWEPRVTFADGLKRTYEWYRSR
ncbi:MAG: NAD-dependent epimerase/dehydratase family protein [Chloroflexi bacterium]|nr:NAD-dependent epimerase/dehydratase family protein [Chloroflexota bacterium]